MPKPEKCCAKTRTNEQCRVKKIQDTNFCKNHQYMCDYTEEQMKNTELCKGCLKHYWFSPDSESKTCSNCKTRGKQNRTKNKERVVFCSTEGCKFKKSDLNEWCMKHQLQAFVKETAESGKKLCCNYIRGCRAQLEKDYAYSKCQDCLQKYRSQYREIVDSIDDSEEGFRRCGSCLKSVSIELFVGERNQPTKHCKPCRDGMKKINANRDKEHRKIIVSVAEQRPHRKMALCRKNAIKRGIEFHLTLEYFENNKDSPCYYCGAKEEGIMNGIDRKISSGVYIEENCVSCCAMCNYMKGALDDDIFLLRVRHIVNYSKGITTGLCPELFADHLINMSNLYGIYKYGAISRGYVFELTLEQFETLRKGNCYICDKQNTCLHSNGIDRVDNAIGYVLDNCKPCCGECNIMKKQYNINKIFEKMEEIYKKHILDKEIHMYTHFDKRNLRIK